MDNLAVTSTPKQPPPQLSDEKRRSTKKVKLRFNNDSPVFMDTEDQPDPSLISQVPDTPSSAVPAEPNSPPAQPKQPSFKDKLLDGNLSCEEEEEEIPFSQNDVTIDLTGPILTINFATHVLETLHRRMGHAVVIKLLGRSIGYSLLRSQLQHL